MAPIRKVSLAFSVTTQEGTIGDWQAKYGTETGKSEVISDMINVNRQWIIFTNVKQNNSNNGTRSIELNTHVTEK
jgi:hypothetical protein